MLKLVRVANAGEELKNETPGLKSDHLDTAGAMASFLCALHCAVLPFVVTMLPLVGLGFLASEPVEWGLIAVSALLGTLSLCLGFREHRSRRVFGLLGIALTLLVAGRIFEERELELWGPALMIAGGLTIAGAHLFKLTLCRSCRACNEHGCSV